MQKVYQEKKLNISNDIACHSWLQPKSGHTNVIWSPTNNTAVSEFAEQSLKELYYF